MKPYSLGSGDDLIVNVSVLNGRYSEKRRQVSREAARCRRSTEAELFMQLNSVLPFSCATPSQLDKMSAVRLAVAYLKLKHIVSAGRFSEFVYYWKCRLQKYKSSVRLR